MRFLGSLVLLLILLVCVPLLSAPMVRAQAPTVIPDANLTFTTIDVPGAVYTGVWGINKTGDIVGNFGQNANLDSHGFLYSNGTFTYFDYPSEVVTVPMEINDSGLVVGYAGQNPAVSFLYDGTTFTTIRRGNDSATYIFGANNAGDMVGGTGTIYTTKAFEMRNGHYKQINFPGQYVYGYASSINNLGVVVGWTSSPEHGYAYRNGKFRSIDFPGANETEAWGINDSGVIVGWYAAPGGCVCGFASRNGKYISFGYPGADTYAVRINASGQIVGQYTFDYQTFHGFVTSPITAADFK
jgi:probable HAF family extracellular repeat protein